MWWQVLPPMAIIGVFMSIPVVGFPIVHYVVTGRPTLRGIVEGMEFECQTKLGYKRDQSLFVYEHVSSGLDNIKDDDD